MADKTFALDSGTTKGKFVDIGNSLFAKADVPLVKTASGLYMPFPITDAGYYPAVLQAGSDVVGKVGIDQTVPGTTNGVQVNSSVLPTGASTEATLALIKAKTDNIPSDPSKESGKLTALETLITTLNEKIDTLDAVIDSIKDTDGIKKITDTVDVQLSGSNVEIGGVTFAVSGGDTLRNTATNKPDAATAHAAIPFCYYHAVDTGVIEVTDGTNWVVM